MMNNNPQHTAQSRFLPTWAIVLITIFVTVIISFFVVRYYFFPTAFKHVELSNKEQIQLDNKLKRLIPGYTSKNSNTSTSEQKFLEPEKYSEEGASRMVSFSEREVNALLANQTDLADKLAIDLSDDLISAKLLVPVDPDFPVLGGKTLRINAGLALSFNDNKPIAILKGVSIMGIPLPNAWLGNMKNIDLIQEFGHQEGFWKSFSEGINALNVEDGQITVQLAK